MEQIRENPYYQFFIGLPGYQDEEPFVPSLLVEFRKRLTDDILGDINEMIIAYNTSDDDPPTGGSGGDGESDETPSENKGTLILDATCAPQEIAYPQDINLLNEARKSLLAQDDVYLKPKQIERLAVIQELVEQQQYMYDNKVHSVKDRIVSISHISARSSGGKQSPRSSLVQSLT